MKVAFIARSTIFTAPGGDSVQVSQTADQLRRLGIHVDIRLAHQPIAYESYDLLHFFNITRPADILFHINQSGKPFVITPILIDYSEYDKYHRKGIPGILFRFLSADRIEYFKTLGRWILGRDKLVSKSYLLKGHRKSILEILQRAAHVLPNSYREFQNLKEKYGMCSRHSIVPNGVNTDLFKQNGLVQKDPNLVICAARIEGIKNQVNLIKALNHTSYKVLLIGSAAPNQPQYYRRCRRLAADNISFIDHLTQEDLLSYYQKAKVHILPSWFETCGLSSLEAGMAGCNLVVSNKGYSEEYVENFAFYCDPSSPASILSATERAFEQAYQEKLREKISTNYTWERAAFKTSQAYQAVLSQTRKLRIGILGTRGIPNYYGGFEQFAEHLSAGLAKKGHEVIVYNAHNHPHQQKNWKNISLEHCYNPENLLGSFGQFVYDFNCILNSRKKNLDVILMLGYTSSSVWHGLFPSRQTVIYNMDGLEWQRTKYSRLVQKFLLYAEKLAITSTRHHIADSVVVQAYLEEKYQVPCTYIPYGAEILNNEDEAILNEYDLKKFSYFLVIARFEPENNIDTILQGFSDSRSPKKMIVVGDCRKKYGRALIKKFGADDRICFIGGIYNNAQKIHTLRVFSYMYFHGHMVGGTNPSLLEAMASRSLIAAHQNAFNRAILQDDAYYFSNAAEVKDIIENTPRTQIQAAMIKNNLAKIHSDFTWQRIIDQYHGMFLKCLQIQSRPERRPSPERVLVSS